MTASETINVAIVKANCELEAWKARVEYYKIECPDRAELFQEAEQHLRAIGENLDSEFQYLQKLGL